MTCAPEWFDARVRCGGHHYGRNQRGARRVNVCVCGLIVGYWGGGQGCI